MELKIIMYSNGKGFQRTPEHVTVSGLHVGYGTKEPKKLDSDTALLTFIYNESELDSLLDLMYEGIEKVELYLTDKHIIKTVERVTLNTEKTVSSDKIKVIMTLT